MSIPDIVSNVMKPRAAVAGQRAIVAGAVGRRGETLLNAVLARGGYEQVVVLTEQPLSMGIKHLATATIDQLPAAYDLFLLISDPGDLESRSFHGRDAPFVLVDEANCIAIATRAAAAGVKRVVLIAPAPFWTQFGNFNRTLGTDLQRALTVLGFARIAVLHPLRQYKAAGSGLMQRIAGIYLSVQMLMTPRTMPVLTSEQIARAALRALNESESGVSVFSATDIAPLLA